MKTSTTRLHALAAVAIALNNAFDHELHPEDDRGDLDGLRKTRPQRPAPGAPWLAEYLTC